nr:MAG TPA: hypothetical protein [Caudoviricetes sp.]
MTLWESSVEMERLRNRYADSVLDKQQELEDKYAEDCRGNHSAILEEFEELKRKNEKLFEEELWDKMKYFVECYYEKDSFMPTTTLAHILNDYIEDTKISEDWEELHHEPTSFEEKEFERNCDKFYKMF